MKKTKEPIRHLRSKLHAVGAALLAFGITGANALPLIVNVVETGGDNEATDTIPAKWTGVTFPVSVDNEPVPGAIIGDNYTVGVFGDLTPSFVDRNHRYVDASADVAPVGLPAYLIGGEVIMSGNDNRDNPTYTLDVTISARANVYMLIDNRLGDPNSLNTDPPVFGPTRMQWILDEGWEAVSTGSNRSGNLSFPDEVAFDEGADGTINQYYSIYKKTFEAGTFQLKQADNTGQNMYGVVVTAAPATTFNVWMVGKDDDGWPVGDGGGENASFVQENGTINELPGNPNNPETDQQSDNDYYFAGDFTTVIAGNGTYAPVGPVAVNEESAERAFAAADNDLRYHFNLPGTLRPDDELSVTFDPLNLHIDAATVPDPRYGIEVYFNGVKVQDEIVIRPADLNKSYTTPKFSLASVGAQAGSGYDNIVSLRGVNYNAEGGGNWMGIDYVKLDSTSNPDSGLVRGILTVKRYNDLGDPAAPGVLVSDLLNHPKYVNDTPDSICYRQDFSANDADECDNCGYSVSGFFIPTQSGPHTFYLAADDGAALFLSTDDSPANKVEIAREPVWTSRRNYIGGDGDGTGTGRDGASPSGGPQQNISGPIELVAGQKYFIEGVVKEGGGGDNLDVAVQGPGDPEVVDGARPIFGDRIAANADIAGSVLTITQNPSGAQVVEGNSATFTVEANASSPLCGGNATYQWQRDGVDIPGATAASYTFGPALMADNGAKFQCVVNIPGIKRTSTAATLEVFPSECLQVVSAAGSFSRTSVKVVFSTLVSPDPATTLDPFSYTIEGSDGSLPVVQTVSLNADGKSVTLLLDGELAETPQYTVSVLGVSSFVGSLVCDAPDNQAIIIPFVSGIGGYSAAVKADGPIAYYRFNDVLPTAVNEGSLGSLADGTYNGDANPGTEAPSFPGFEAGNTAVQLDGTGDFVGTAIGLLNAENIPSGAFTITGWLRRNGDQADRTGLWGQNDQVEIGYINNNTLEVWTDNGLHQSPDPTVNPFPNGTWNHLAIVSEGSPGIIKMYTNGVLAAERSHTLPGVTTFNFNIGGGGIFDDPAANGNFFNGQIDEVAVYSKALTPEQVDRQYRAAFRTPGYDFEDGQLPPGTIATGTTPPYVQNGVLHLTDAVGSQANFWTVPLEGAKTYSSIKASWKTLIDTVGGADGMSFTVGTDIGTAFTPEDGPAAGLTVCVDTYNNGAGDAGLDIKYNGVTLTHLPVPAAGGPDGGGSPAELAIGQFVETSVEVSPTGFVTFKYAGFEITAQIPNYSFVGANQYVFAARTGGAFENCWIDDVVFSGEELGGPSSITITLQPVDQSFVVNPANAGGVALIDEDFTGGDGGFTATTPQAFNTPWTYDAVAGSWQVTQDGAEVGYAMTSYLDSPALVLTRSGFTQLDFSHRFSFENAGGNWDGGRVEISVNGGPFVPVPGSAFTANGYNGTVVAGNSAISGQQGFVGDSDNHQGPGYVGSSAGIGFLTAGDSVVVRFLYAGDTNTRGNYTPSWEVTSVKLVEGIAPVSVTFSTAAVATVPGDPNPPVNYQWQRNGEPVAGATLPNYTFVPVIGDNGATYRCVVTTTGAEATSDEATLTVVQQNTPPQFACGPDQGVNEDAGAQVVAGWATDIQNHSIARNPVLLSFDFSSMPDGTRALDPSGPAARPDPRVEDGVLKLTDANDAGGFGGWAIGPFEAAVFESVDVKWKSRVGGGGGGGADGYSLNIGTDLAEDFQGEEGTGTGLSVTVDTFDNGTGQDVGVDIKWAGTRVAYAPLPKDDDGSGNYIRKDAFVDAHLTVDAAGLATLTYDGNTVSASLPGYIGVIASKVVFGARTGGANDNQWIDDLEIAAYPFDASSSEAGQTVAFIVSNDNPSLFSAEPAIAADGTLTYTPAPNASGVAHVTVVAQDDGGTANGGRDTSAPCTFTITVAGVCDAITANNDAAETVDSTPVTIAVLANDSDIEGGLSIAGVSQGANGTVAVSGDSVIYTANAGFSGVDTFTYSVVNSCGSQASATVTVTVTGGSVPPTAVIGTDALVDFSPDYENPVLISCNWWNACLVLDGWTSSAADGGALTYLWFDELEPVPFDGGVVVTNCYEVGEHTITLIVTDSRGLTGTDSKTIEVVTAPLAVELLIEKVNQSHVARSVKRELVASLRAALASAKAEKGRPMQQTLDAFEKKVRAKVVDAYPEEARVWIKWSQAISSGMEKCMKPPRKAKDHWDKKKEDDK